ncbi:sulfotransferase [Aliiglaciecola sp. CAU 1673]|uniref:tetratricopeptide repeat-containing sulfotransferase family protein n=1 Tax=Aliiglaciecola sp. CAU 1673 TaxID=3032595 RepID=UPI0023D996B1|nr:tetratricopeptide repeat-containing sulfotransferase family protein [Aliiglaciecola sp. CAU 1673]MDF2179042.1 sulfotransferase [Aliiglaciecola sp. CAU 1673]
MSGNGEDLMPSRAQQGKQARLMEAQCLQALNQGRADEALQLCQQLNHDYPDYARGWLLLSDMALRGSHPQLALEAIDRALSLQPGEPEFLLHKARLLYQAKQIAVLDVLLERLAETPIHNACLLADLAYLENLRGRLSAAEQHYRQALVLDPGQVGYHFNLATVLRYVGKLDEAEVHLERAIALRPLDTEAHLLLSQLRRQTLDDHHLPRLRRLSEHPELTRLQKAQVHYALAKELEDLGHFQESVTALRQGAALKRANMRYEVDGDIATLDKLRSVFDRQWLAQTKDGHDSEEPIFVLGLPRTGSTLVERILSAHSEVQSVGELNNFALCIMAQCRRTFRQAPASKLKLVEMSAQLDMGLLGRDYVQSTRPDTGQHRHFIDKLPLNSLNLGLIAKALPNSKLILVRRHPLDSCYAMFKQLFTQGYPFSYDLKELAGYFIAHHRLMGHWQALLGDRLLCLDYETLVTQPEQQIQALLGYCNLPWQDACLTFHQHNEPSKTASASQIRQPLYTSSVGKWRQVEALLAPVHEAFTEAGIPC